MTAPVCTRTLYLLLAAALWGCSGTVGTADPSETRLDGGAQWDGGTDGGANPTDAGGSDGDGGMIDGGNPADAGDDSDAGPSGDPDGGTSDGGPAADAGFIVDPASLRAHTSPALPVLGAAISAEALKMDATYAHLAGTQFNSVTPENAMKWSFIQPDPGVWTFADADALVDFAEAHQQRIRGHTLVCTHSFQRGSTAR